MFVKYRFNIGNAHNPTPRLHNYSFKQQIFVIKRQYNRYIMCTLKCWREIGSVLFVSICEFSQTVNAHYGEILYSSGAYNVNI